MVQEARCVNCGLNIEKDYILFVNGQEYAFDSFECAANFSAPRCSQCNSIIMGNPTQKDGAIFCSEKCLEQRNYPPLIP